MSRSSMTFWDFRSRVCTRLHITELYLDYGMPASDCGISFDLWSSQMLRGSVSSKQAWEDGALSRSQAAWCCSRAGRCAHDNMRDIISAHLLQSQRSHERRYRVRVWCLFLTSGRPFCSVLWRGHRATPRAAGAATSAPHSSSQ